MGKSRLIAELFRVIDEEPDELIAWRQGRSLPYGNGVTFWALSEMVKAHAGILENDSPEEAGEKLRASVESLFPESTDTQWVERHLRPLAGVSGSTDGGDAPREEAFVAWRRFFEALAERGPLVLVFEDLHWADDNLLEFVEHLVGWAGGVPLLVVCTARPELFERRVGWGGGMRNSTTLWLGPLSDAETAKLISSLSERPVMEAGTQQALLSRAGGNPLYAEQYVRMLEEGGNTGELALPETVQGIIAARLDALPGEEKRLLQSAAVIGKVFWLGALAEVGGAGRRDAELSLHALERKDFVQRARRSSMAEEAEYSFLHVLVRDVAYGQIPRGQRAEVHRLAAEWIPSRGRIEDHAEMLAYHYTSALELRRAAGQAIDLPFAEHAVESMRDAGDRAFSLAAYNAAGGFYKSALELLPATSLERGHLPFKLGRTRYLAGDDDPELLTAACAELIACGEPETAAEAEALLADVYWHRGDRDGTFEHLDHAQALVKGCEPSRAVAYVISSLAGHLMQANQNGEAIRAGREAPDMAQQLRLDDMRSLALRFIGVSRVHIGDAGGMEDLEQSVALAVAANAPKEICGAKANLAAMWWGQGRLKEAYALIEEALEAASRFGLIGEVRWFRGDRVWAQYAFGDWDIALAGSNDFIAQGEAGSPHYLASFSYSTRALIRLGRDDTDGAVVDANRALELARIAQDPQLLHPVLAGCAHVLLETGSLNEADLLADEFLSGLRAGSNLGSASESAHVLAWTLCAVGRADELIEALPITDSLWTQAGLAFANGDLTHAADICAAMGALTEEARDRLWLAESLVRENRRAEANIEVQRALAFYRSVGANRYIREGEALFAVTA